MGTITTKDGIEIFYKDWGKGQPIVFSHGWPLSADDWDAQMLYWALGFPKYTIGIQSHTFWFPCFSARATTKSDHR